MSVNKKHAVALTINGVPREGSVEARQTLADFLRHQLNLTATISP